MRQTIPPIVLLALLATPPAAAQDVEHVFVMVLDGVRASEAFDDPDHEHVGALINGLAPIGSLLTGMENRAQTVTLSAHQVYVSGTYADVGNTSPYTGRQYYLPRSPTVFEAYRRHTGAPADSCWVVSNIDLVGPDATHSLMPGYGSAYAANALYEQDQPRDDAWAWEKLHGVFAQYEPQLLLFNLHDPDDLGHLDDWFGYTGRTRNGSSEIVQFWNDLQADPVYAGNTVMFVTTDHGRHLEGEGAGWKGHGDECRGCRKVFLLAVGPGIRQGFVSDEPVSLLDVAPTIAHLMDFPFPYHRGRVLTDILEDGPTVDAGPGGQYRPRTVRHGDVVVRLSEQQDPTLHDAEAAHQILIELSEDRGQTWSSHTTGGALAQYSPFAWIDGETLLVGWLEIDVPGTAWFVRLRRMELGTGVWVDVFRKQMVARSTPHGNAQLLLSADGERLALFESNAPNQRFRAWVSDDMGVSWPGDALTYNVPRLFPRDLSVMDVGTARLAVFSAHAGEAPIDEELNDNTEIYWLRSVDEGETWEGEYALTDDPRPSIQPVTAVTPDGVAHAVWVDMVDGLFQLFHAESTDDGETFSLPVQLTWGALGSWEPTLAVDGETLWVGWSEVQTNETARIRVAILEEDSLVDLRVLGAPDAMSRTPSIQPLGDCTSLVSWSQGNLVGAWTLASAVTETGRRPASSAQGLLLPATLEAGAGDVELTLTVELGVESYDLGVGGLAVTLPEGFALVGDASADVDGVPAAGAAGADGAQLWFTLDEPIVDDGTTLALRITVTPPTTPGQSAPFEAFLYRGDETCTTAVEGDLTIELESADDDTAGDDDLPYPDDDDDCSCRVPAGTSGPASVAALLVAAAALALRRRRA